MAQDRARQSGVFELKRTIGIALLAALVPAAAVAQATEPAAAAEPARAKYEVYAGFSYTSLNQVSLSRHGLMGGKVSVTRNFGQYMGLMAAVDYNRMPTGSGNPGSPVVYSALAGPELHFDIYGPLSAQLFAELGYEHTGGEKMSPSSSFAGGFGGGMTWRLTNRWAVRVSGDRIGAAFSPQNNTPTLALSPHVSWNARATVGAVYRF